MKQNVSFVLNSTQGPKRMPLEKNVFFAYVMSQKGSKFQAKHMQNIAEHTQTKLPPKFGSFLSKFTFE